MNNKVKNKPEGPSVEDIFMAIGTASIGGALVIAPINLPAALITMAASAVIVSLGSIPKLLSTCCDKIVSNENPLSTNIDTHQIPSRLAPDSRQYIDASSITVNIVPESLSSTEYRTQNKKH